MKSLEKPRDVANKAPVSITAHRHIASLAFRGFFLYFKAEMSLQFGQTHPSAQGCLEILQ